MPNCRCTPTTRCTMWKAARCLDVVHPELCMHTFSCLSASSESQHNALLATPPSTLHHLQHHQAHCNTIKHTATPPSTLQHHQARCNNAKHTATLWSTTHCTTCNSLRVRIRWSSQRSIVSSSRPRLYSETSQLTTGNPSVIKLSRFIGVRVQLDYRTGSYYLVASTTSLPAASYSGTAYCHTVCCCVLWHCLLMLLYYTRAFSCSFLRIVSVDYS